MVTIQLTPAQESALREFTKPAYQKKYSFDGAFQRRVGYRATDFASTQPVGKSQAKGDKVALREFRSKGTKPFLQPERAYMSAGVISSYSRQSEAIVG